MVGDVTGSLRAIDRARLEGIRARTWPKHSVDEWLRLAGPARARYNAGHAPTPLEAKALAVEDAVRQSGGLPYANPADAGTAGRRRKAA